MTSLLDIGPLTEEVAIGAAKVTIHGVTPEGFFYLLEKFPTLAAMFGGGVKNVDMAMLTAVAPTCVAHALAVATLDRASYESAAAWREDIARAASKAMNLPAHYQMAIFQSAIRLTFPEGLGPFIKAVEALATSVNQISGVEALATTFSKPSRSGFVTDSRGMRLGKAAPFASSRH